MPLASYRLSRRTVVPVDVQGNVVVAVFGALDRSWEAAILDVHGGTAEIGTHQFIPKTVVGEAIVADQIRVEPSVSVVLDGMIVSLAGESHSVGADTVFVVDDLGVCTIPTNVLGLLQVVLAMGRGTNIFGLVSLCPDDDVFPVVAVASSDTANVLEGDILLEVIAVHVDTPAVIASGANVGVAVVQETRFTASSSVGSVAVVESRVESPISADGWDIVATIRIEIKSRLELFVVIRSAGGDLGRVIPRHDPSTLHE
jgi:hypothetical protein